MKKRSILALLLLVAVLMQYCKKSSDDSSTTTADTVLFQAYVNGAIWTPVKTTPVLTYNAAAKTKTFTWTADSTSDRIVINNKVTSVGPGTGFPVQIYYVDTTAAAKVTMTYYKLINNVYTTVGTTRSGYMNITAIDSVKQTITGNFGFSETKLNYTNNVLTSITTTAITNGEFNALPYTYVKQ